MSRNLFIATLFLSAVCRWLVAVPSDYWSMRWTLLTKEQGLSQYPEFLFSGYFILTESYIVNRWWLAICMMRSCNWLWWHLLNERACMLTVLLFKTIEIWFTKQHRKPPDKENLVFTSYSQWIYENLMLGFTSLLYVFEDLIYFTSGYNIDLSVIIYITANVLMDYFKEYISILIDINFNSSSQVVEGEEWINLIQSTKIPFMEVNKNVPFYFKDKTINI